MNEKVAKRLMAFHEGMQILKKKGLPVDSVVPEGAIYLTIQFDLKDKVKINGDRIQNTADITQFLLEEAKLAVVPFSAFGASKESNWYRLSVGTATERDVQEALHAVEKAITMLS
jgi:aspartate aminotransferase